MLIEIINTPEYARMGEIGQLPFKEFRFIGAIHTRRDHCIGSLELMNALIGRNNIPMDFWDRANAARAAILTHDIGHVYPGHAFARAMGKMFPDTFQDHEQIGRNIVRNGRIFEILESYKTGFGDIVLDIMGEENLDRCVFKQVYSGGPNMDTFDYLTRDVSHAYSINMGKMVRKIIANTTLDCDAARVIMSKTGAETFRDLLNIRGKMYANVYYDSFTHAADCFVTPLMNVINNALKNPDAKPLIKSIGNNPFVNFIESGATSIPDYLALDNKCFYDTVRKLRDSGICELAKIADAYCDIPNKFMAVNIYRGRADYEFNNDVLQELENITHNAGGIFNNAKIRLYNMNKPDVYVRVGRNLKAFSELYPEILSGDMRNISAFFIKDAASVRAADEIRRRLR
ncbi:MAG: HD domain-containing protein [Alphaproteobacteria bacterium]|nr:HD domain-containing protein [Alphaproteobacteria bacterium]